MRLQGANTKGSADSDCDAPITDQTWKDLLIHIANTAGFKTDSGLKSDKLPDDLKIEWAAKHVQEPQIQEIVDNPIGSMAHGRQHPSRGPTSSRNTRHLHSEGQDHQPVGRIGCHELALQILGGQLLMSALPVHQRRRWHRRISIR